MRAVVIGANGQLGTDLVKILSGWDIEGLTHSDLDIRTWCGRVRFSPS